MPLTFRIVEPADVGERFEEAAAQLGSAPLSLSIAGLPHISALLMAGAFERVRPLLTRPDPAPALPLAAAWYHAWTGDLATVMGCFATVRDSIDLVAGTPDPALHRETWSWLERTATDVGDPALSAALVRRSRDAIPDARFTYEGPAAVIHDVVSGLLGVEPDAHRGRIRLRPRLGSHDSIVASGIRFADGAVTLRACRDGDGATFTIEQDAGAMPFTALLEPVVAAAAGAEVDGQPARLDIRPGPDGFTVPVQLVLDERRTLTVRAQ